MKYVLDASVAFKWLVSEADSDKALRLRDDFRNGSHELLAPDILPIEVGVSAADGFILWSGMMADCPHLVPSLALMPQACALSSRAKLGIYDCLYVALAEQEQCKLVSDDARLATLFPKQVVSLSTF